MKWTYASGFMIVFGIVGIFILFLFQDITVSNEDDYYLLKEITEAAMMESVDRAYYSASGGEIKIIQEKFVESFTRRFAESSTLAAMGYTVEIIDVIEKPPKVTVRVKNSTKGYTVSGDGFDIINELSAILETSG